LRHLGRRDWKLFQLLGARYATVRALGGLRKNSGKSVPLYIYCIKLLSRRLWRICAAETRDEDGLPPLRPRKANGGSRRRRGCVEGCAAAARAASYAAARGAHAIASTPHRRPGTAGVEGAAAAPVLPARLHTARRRAQPVGGQKAAAPAWGGAIASAAAASGRACWHPRTPLPGRTAAAHSAASKRHVNMFLKKLSSSRGGCGIAAWRTWTMMDDGQQPCVDCLGSHAHGASGRPPAGTAGTTPQTRPSGGARPPGTAQSRAQQHGTQEPA